MWSRAVPVPGIRPTYFAYFWLAWAAYLVVTVVAVMDRFTWNVSPRQSFALVHGWTGCETLKPFGENGTKMSSSCGGDYFCGSREEFVEYKGEMPRKVGGHWCLKEGEGSVKLYDVLSRSSGRIIITTTSLLFLTMCHCTWNSLAGLPRLRGFLGNVRADNQKLHRWGGLVCGVCTVIHVWSLFLPSVLNGYTNKFVNEEPFSWPAQWSLGTSQVDVAARTANWGLDDVWRLVWMSVIFCALFPLSRSIRMLATNYSLAMWLHVGVGLGFFIDSWRRRTHPHVWLWNTPVVLWYVVDRVAGCTWYRTCARDVERFRLDDAYQVLMWKHASAEHRRSRSVADIYWLKSARASGLARAFEWAHPFTTASTHRLLDGSLTIEPPSHVDDHFWAGHKFRVDDAIEAAGGPKRLARYLSGRMHWPTTSSVSLNTVQSFRSEENAEDEGAASPQSPESWSSGWSASSSSVVLVGSPNEVRRPTKLLFVRQSTKRFTAAQHAEREAHQHLAGYDQIQIVRVHDGGAGCARHAPETLAWARASNPSIPMRVMGPYRSEYGELFDLLAEQRRPPILCVSTGAGAGLVLDVVSTLRTLKHVGATPVEVIFSTWSVNLLQYVTNQLLAEAVPGLQVSAALTRVEDEVDLEDPKGKGGLSFDRIDLNATIDGLTDDDTRVYFCGAGAVNRVLARACERRGVQFVGSSVESSPPPSQPPMEDERESEREEETVISIHHHEDECCERGPRSADSSELEAPVPFASSLGASFLNLFAAKN